MRTMGGLLAALGLSAGIVIGQGNARLRAQNTEDPNAAPNPYHMEDLIRAMYLPALPHRGKWRVRKFVKN